MLREATGVCEALGSRLALQRALYNGRAPATCFWEACLCSYSKGRGARAAPESLGNHSDGHESGVQAGNRAASCIRSQMRSECCVCGRTAVGPTVASCSHTCAGVLAATATCHSCVCNARRHTGQNSAPRPAGVQGGASLPPQTPPQPRPLCCLGCAEPRDPNPRTGGKPPRTTHLRSPNWPSSHCDPCLETLQSKHKRSSLALGL